MLAYVSFYLHPSSGTRDRARCSAFSGRAALLALVGAWVLLRLLAAASPPDPTWIAGLWDDDDFDDVVIFIGSLVGVSDMPGPAPTRLDEPTRRLVPVGPPPPISVSLLTLLDRSPPQA